MTADTITAIKKALKVADTLQNYTDIDAAEGANSDVVAASYAAVKTIEDLASTLESLQRENEGLAKSLKSMRDRYERWMPVTDNPPHGLNPVSLLSFYCVEEAPVDPENPAYWSTGTWDEKPSDAIYWCAIMSPDGPHERTFIARTALSSTGDTHGN